MSKVYRQTLGADLAPKVEETRLRLGLTIQEITILALALFCEQQRQCSPSPPPEEAPAYELTW